MDGKKSRRKGKEGELWVGRWLYRVWYDREPEPDRQVFVRTKVGVRQDEGDIVVPPEFPFVVEVKNRLLHPIADLELFTQICSELIGKAEKQGKEGGLLFFRLNKRTWCSLYVTKPQIPLTPLPLLWLLSGNFTAVFVGLEQLEGQLKFIRKRRRRGSK